MITLTDVYKVYDQGDQRVAALNGVSLHVPRGEIFGVLGPSGAGKSTLIRCVNLLERPTSGSVQVAGQEMTRLSPEGLRRARQRIGMIFQHFNLLNSRTVAGNVAYPLEISGCSADERQRRVAELLSLVGLSDKANAYPSQLSGGQKQRVGIARALANNPDVLLSDEATSALDPQNTIAILNLLRDLNQRLGLTILLITHEMNVVKQVCRSVAIMEEGRIIEQGTVSRLVSSPGSHLARALLPPLDPPPVSPGTTTAIITFIGALADQPVLSSLVQQFDVEVNILSGSIQNVGGQRVGQLQVGLRGGQVSQALDHLRRLGLRVEVH